MYEDAVCCERGLIKMPRGSRIDAAGALHHVIGRGIERRNIFADDADRDAFVRRLAKVLTETKTSCLAWALIPNHFHLLLRTGAVPIATVMRRLLTGYAQEYNRRHGRHGQLFQNRYKSILCQEEPYLIELVRYIHLNPLRAGIVDTLEGLAAYRYCGHGVLLGRTTSSWQDVDYVLGHFGGKAGAARKSYLRVVEAGIAQGRRTDLTGGGLIRSAGGWKEVLTLKKAGMRMKGDERILGDGRFVTQVMRESEKAFGKRMRLKQEGYDLRRVAQKVNELVGVDPLRVRGKNRQAVQARRVFCYWAVRELGVSGTVVAKELDITQAAVSMAVKEGERMTQERGWRL